jgi:hypothetical protein
MGLSREVPKCTVHVVASYSKMINKNQCCGLVDPDPYPDIRIGSGFSMASLDPDPRGQK